MRLRAYRFGIGGPLAAICMAHLTGPALSQTPAPAPDPVRQLLGALRPALAPFSAQAIDEVARLSKLTSCFWVGTVSPSTFNILFPDTGTTYWLSQYKLPDGAKLQLTGEFPHARHISFNAYDNQGQPVDRINDALIASDSGSTNPFVVGALRDASPRKYTVTVATADVKAGARVDDATRPPNTIHAPKDGNAVQLWYRIYVPDQGRDAKGGVALPEPVVTLADGSVVSGQQLCDRFVQKEGAVRDIKISADVVRQTYALPGKSPAQPAQREPKWDAFFNGGLSASRLIIGTEFEPMREKQDRTRSGGFYSTIDNTYMSVYVDNRLGKVLTMRGKAPTTPSTLAGTKTMQAADLRYWSVCKYRSLADTAVDSCLYDEQVPRSAAGTFTIVMSAPEDRPANARTECGVAWLPWGIGDGIANPYGGYLVWRQMVPSAGFYPHSIFATTALHQEEAVLGEYYPKLQYTSRESFEGEGCTGRNK